MTTIQHPSQWLDRELTSRIRENAFEAEQQRKLTVDQLKIVYDNNWLRMFVPTRLGGPGFTLPQVLRVEEGLSWADGSTAWVVTLCSGAGWFVGFLDHEITRSLTGNDLFCIAGSGAASGAADINDDGYLINGSWKYASGSLHATAFTVNCMITKNGQQQYNADGSPTVRSFLLMPNEVSVRQTWNSMGMVATGSHSFDIESLQVSAQRCFMIDVAYTTLPDTVYKYPFLQLAETTLAVNLSGLAARFIDLCESSEVTKANDALTASRQRFFNSADDSWSALVNENVIPLPTLSMVSTTSHDLVKTSRDIMNSLYPLCGLRAADKDTEINRVWRNFHTAGQHALFRRNE